MRPWIEWLLVRNNGVVMSGRYLKEPPWKPSEAFKRERLKQKQHAGYEPRTLGGVVSFNENYMDVVDWAYQKVGPPEVFWIFGMLYMPMSALRMVVDFILNPWSADLYVGGLWSLVFVCLLTAPFFFWFGRILYYTFTGYTYYPVRLDRKNQMVHVFHHGGEDGVRSYRWNDITFGLVGGGAQQRSFVQGVTAGYVRRDYDHYDYFRLGVMSPSEDDMRGQWEYFRRYMEEGPDSLPEPEILLPIDGKRESFRLGAQLCWFMGGPFLSMAIFFAPLTVPGSFVRWFIMHVTRRVPRWPQHIIDQCPVSPHDKYAYKPRKSLDVSCDLAFFVTAGVLAFDGALLYWFIKWLSTPGYH